jgi:protein-disulfide isomerase
MNSQKNNIFIPLSIVIAGVLIAGALFIVKKPDTNGSAAVANAVNTHPEQNMKAVSADEHILGNPNAPIKIVEYSDTDCPYCQAFQPSIHRIINEYGKDGKVAWVYRHLAFHPKAPKEAEATECVAELGGNDKFWQYLDLLFSKKNFKESPYQGLDPAQLPVLAASIGINKAAFTTCLSSGKYAQKVSDSYQDALNSSSPDKLGTPYTILVSNSVKVPISGAVSYESLKSAVQTMLNEKTQ